MATIRLARVVGPRLIGALIASILACPVAYALDNIQAPPTTARYWSQNSAGLNVPPAVGLAEPFDRFGSAVASGDFNGDGFDDLAIGSPGEDIDTGQISESAGVVTILDGSIDGLTTFSSKTLMGGEDFDNLGVPLASGDINGDGYDDLVAGIPGWNEGNGADAGRIAIAYGASNGLTFFTDYIDQDSPQIDNNSETFDQFGFSVSVGDINADGFDDVAVGTPGESYGSSGGSSGAVYVLYGADDGLQGTNAPRAYQVFVESSPGLPHESTGGNRYGAAVLLHDMDGDDDDDLIVGAPLSDVLDLNAGLVYIHPSDGAQIGTTNSTLLDTSDFPNNVFTTESRFGRTLAGGANSASGSDQLLLIGAPYWGNGAGRAYLYQPGSAGNWTFARNGEVSTLDGFSAAVLMADLNGDGLVNDFVISAPGDEDQSGTVYLLARHQDWRTLREGDSGVGGVAEADDAFGYALARGNFRASGRDEIAIGVRAESIGAGVIEAAGMVLVVGWTQADSIFANGLEGELSPPP